MPLVRALLLMAGGDQPVGGAYTAMLPAVAGGRCNGGPHALGWLMGAGGAGALVGTLYLASRG